MRARTSLLVVAALALGVFVVGGGVSAAHECWDASNPPPDYTKKKAKGDSEYWRDGDRICRETPVMPNWRDNYVPVFDLEDRDDEQQRYDAQRWRDECRRGQSESHQMCQWSYGGFSGFPNSDDPDTTAPNEWHAGFAATHCFLFEFAHQCEDHETERGEGVHDAHGGATYVDVCLTANPESKYCDDGPADTQVGVTVMDHFPCGQYAPVASCTDEYHVVRPLDAEYTQRQMENSQASVQLIADDPGRYVCGHHASADDCREQFPLP